MSISKTTAKKILIESGAKRVSDDAAVELADLLNKIAYSISNKAIKLSAHAKRTTIKKSDIDLAK